MGYDVKFQESWFSVDNVDPVLLKVKGKELLIAVIPHQVII